MNLDQKKIQPINLTHITQNLKLQNGIWYSQSSSEISFPEAGYNACYQIEEYSFWFKHRNNCIIETVKHFSPATLLFDIGGGNGYVAYGLEKAGVNTVLVEPGINGVLNAQKRGLSNIICSKLEDINIKEGTLEAVGIFDVVEHIEDDMSFLTLLNKYLKMGGIIYITVPAFNILWSKEDDLAGHHHRYTLKSLGDKLKSTGFEILYSTYFFSFLPIPVFLFRTITGRLGINKHPEDLKKHQKAHSSGKGIMNNFLQNILKWELKKIKNQEKIPFGGSCLFVCRKF